MKLVVWLHPAHSFRLTKIEMSKQGLNLKTCAKRVFGLVWLCSTPSAQDTNASPVKIKTTAQVRDLVFHLPFFPRSKIEIETIV